MKSIHRKLSGLALVLGLSALLCTSCSDDVQVDNGLVAKVRVAGAQFQDRAFPADTSSDASVAVTPLADGGVAGRPGVIAIDSQNNSVKRGTVNKALRIVVGELATTVAVGLEGDRGYWVLPATVRSLEFAPALELTATLDFDRTLPVGRAKVWFAAADASGRYGAPRSLDVNIVEDVPTAPLVVSLDWTQNMDLDLVITQPNGAVVTNKATRSAAAGPDAPKIDFDSNSNCLLDGHRAENASFTVAQPGEYLVYVRQAESCGFPATGWRVRLIRDGQEVSQVDGVSYAYEANLPNGGPSGPGRLALRFNIGG